ncbi:MAG: hypothetical protein IK045_06520 [Bacteroidales bacterium]|nr:hypothetical protein [Bacteroidales bacterium]
MSRGGDRVFKVVTIVVIVITLLIALYIMVFRLGLSDKFDFGAGSYFYTDHPELQDAAESASYTTSVPKWLHYVLFFGWGYLMWRLWVWIDNRGKND